MTTEEDEVQHVFIPAKKESEEEIKARLPRQVQAQWNEANRIAALKEDSTMHPKRGPAPTLNYKPPVGFIADTELELYHNSRVFWSAVGVRKRGNKRLGRARLYADLVKYFLQLKQRGITLPRNKNLSKKACAYGLGEILRRHNCTSASDALILKSGKEREKIAAKMDRIFCRVADSVENTPA